MIHKEKYSEWQETKKLVNKLKKSVDNGNYTYGDMEKIRNFIKDIGNK